MAGVTTVDGTASPPSWVSATLNGAGDWKLRGLAPYLFGLMMLFDSWDSLAIAFTLPSLFGLWHMTPVQGGLLVSAGYGGQFFGAILGGMLAERFGRLPVVRVLVTLMGLLALACGFAHSYDQLILIRAVQGLTIGGALPATISYINEIAPAATRGKFFSTFQFLMLAGFAFASMSSAYIVPHFGWQAMFMLGGLPLLLVPFSFAMPESPRWLARRGRNEEARKSLEKLGGRPVSEDVGAETEPAKQASIGMLFSPKYRRTTVVVALLWFLTSLVSFGLVTWVPSIYVSAFHVPLALSLKYSAYASVAIFFIPLVMRQILDVVGRRPPPIVGSAGSFICLLTLAFSTQAPVALIVTLVVIGSIAGSIGSIVLWPFTAESYDTEVRATALGAASSLARAASMLTPLAVGGLLSATGSIAPVFALFGTSSTIAFLLWIFATKETKGKEIDG